jgi:CRISPR system Cascade subunit CasE
MYLSRLSLNPRSRQVRSELGNLYELHRTLMQAFPDGADGPGRVLFRLEEDRRSMPPQLLVQSEASPDWRPHKELPDYLLEPPESKQVAPEFSPGQVLRYRLLANPTFERDGQRLGILDEEGQRQWLRRKGDGSGFDPVSCVPRPQGFVRPRKNGRTLTFYSVQFDGALRVTHPEALQHTLRDGIGHGKAFGFGLLSVAPAGAG